MELIQAILKILTVVAISFLLSLLAMQAIRLTGADLKDFKQRSRLDVLSIAAVFNLLFIAAVGLLLRLWDQQPVTVLGFSMRSWDWIFVIAAFLFSAGVALLFVWLLKKRKIIRVTPAKKPFGTADDLPVTILQFIVLFVSALQEEVLFRGYFAHVLLPFGFIYALLISTVVFTFWHYLTNKISLLQTIDWFIGGLMLFVIYWLSGSVWLAAIVHFSRNFINVIIFNIGQGHAFFDYNKPVPPKFKTIYTFSYSLVLIIGAVYYFQFFN